jgi:regulator of sigma E protease
MANGTYASPTIVDKVDANSAAAAAGIRPGDVLHSVNGKSVPDFMSFYEEVSASAQKPLRLGIRRGNVNLTVVATPRLDTETLIDGTKREVGRLGLTPRVVPMSFGGAFVAACNQTWAIISGTFSYVGKMIGGTSSTRELRGPAGIADLAGRVAQFGFIALLSLTALISVSIGLLNLFPIPVLDGGHLLYYAFEAVLGRPLGERAQEVGFRLGLALVLALMLLATFNDLVRFNLF